MIKMLINRPGLIEIHMAVVLFGFAGLFGKFLELSPVIIVFGRTFFAALTLSVLMVFTETYTRLNKRDGVILFAQGVILAVHWMTFFYSIQISTVAVGLLAASTFPLFVTFMEPFFFRERLRFFDIVTATAVLGGLILMIPEFDFSNQITRGAFWGTLAGLSFAVLSLMNRKFATTYSAIQIAFSQNAVAALVLLPFLLTGHRLPDPGEIFLLGVLGVFCTAMAHVLFIRSLKIVKTQLVSVITGLESVYGIVFAFLLLAEVPAPRTLGGGVVILGTIVVATIGCRKK